MSLVECFQTAYMALRSCVDLRDLMLVHSVERPGIYPPASFLLQIVICVMTVSFIFILQAHKPAHMHTTCVCVYVCIPCNNGSKVWCFGGINQSKLLSAHNAVSYTVNSLTFSVSSCTDSRYNHMHTLGNFSHFRNVWHFQSCIL